MTIVHHLRKALPGKARSHFTLWQQVSTVKWYTHMKQIGFSQRFLASQVKINPKTIRNWPHDYQAMVLYKKNAKAMKGGPCSQLKSFEHEILQFIFEHCKQGLAMSCCSAIMKASKLLPSFSVKSMSAKYSAMRRFLDAHDLVFWLGTRQSQKSPMIAHADLVDFVKTMHSFLHGPAQDPKFILNMDQTPVYYSMHEKGTLNKKCDRTVNVRTSKKESECVTVAMTISAAGNVLPPTIVFKGETCIRKN